MPRVGTCCVSPIAVPAIEMQKKMSILRKVGRGGTAGTFYVSPVAALARIKKEKHLTSKLAGALLFRFSVPRVGLPSGGFESGTFFVSPIAVPAIEKRKRPIIFANTFADACSSSFFTLGTASGT